MLLPQLVLAMVARIRSRIGEMLRAVQLDRHARFGTEQTRFEGANGVERDPQLLVEAEPPFVWRALGNSGTVR